MIKDKQVCKPFCILKWKQDKARLCFILQPRYYCNLTAPILQPTVNQEQNDHYVNQHYSRELLMVGIVVPETTSLKVDGAGKPPCLLLSTFINSLAWENGFTHVVDNPPWWGALLGVYHVQHGISFTASSIVQGISDHHGVYLKLNGKKVVVNLR